MNEATCLAGGQCDDWEFGNGEGACVYTPSQPYRCEGQDRPIRSGKCISNQITTSGACTGTKVWTTRAKNATACAALGSYCITADGRRSNTNSIACTACGGRSYPMYKWNAPQWVAGKMVNTTFVQPVQWQPINKWTKALDTGRLRNVIENAASAIIARKITADFNKRYSLLSTVFEAVACDCLSTRTDCFASSLNTPLESCNIDPAETSSCNGVVVTPSTFKTTVPVTTEVTLVSSANLVGSSALLRKRSTTGTSYDVVSSQDGKGISVQIIGNGYSYTFSTVSSSSVTVCTPVDSSISQDSTSFPLYGISVV